MVGQWEEFAAGPRAKAGEEIHVTLNKSGHLFLNKVAVEALGDPPAAVLLFDRINSRIGVRPSRASASNAFPLKLPKQRAARLIFASTFCQHYGIHIEGTIAFHHIDIDNDMLMTLDLTKTTRVRRLRKGKK